MIDPETPIGTPHVKARCCWCQRPLVVARVLQLLCWVCPVDWRRQVQHALTVKADDAKQAKLLGVPRGTTVCLDVPIPSQVSFEEATARFVLWGGQAGPGKSHGVRKWLYRRSLRAPGHEALLLRENWEQLDNTHIRAMKAEVPMLGGEFSNRTARLPNGSMIDCGHMADAEAVSRYLSTEYGAIVPEEASLYPVNAQGETPLAELSTRARKAYRDINGQVMEPRFMPVTNPGGPSSSWLRDMFVDHAPDYDRYPMLRPVFAKGEQTRGYRAQDWVYLPAKLADNPYMRPDYAETDLAVLTGIRFRQLAEGDWHVFTGQFFSEWHDKIHVRTIEPTRDGQWFRSLDWGRNQPGCVLWWTVLADHKLYIRREYKFQGMSEQDVAAEVKKIDQELGLTRHLTTFADPAIFNKTGATHQTPQMVGQSIGESLNAYGLRLVKADNDRFNGWGRCHALLRVGPDGTAWQQVHPDCRYLIRSIAGAVSDENDPDDVDTHSDDHALDAWRYGAMSRPHPTHRKAKRTFAPGTMGALRQGTYAAA